MLLLLLLLAPCCRAVLLVGGVTPAEVVAALQQQAGSAEDSPQCRRDAQRWGEALEARQLWALRMTDAWSKSVDGVLNGNTWSFGDFRECLEVSSGPSFSSGSEPEIRGAYFLPTVTITATQRERRGNWSGISAALDAVVPVSLHVAACLPDSCEPALVLAAARSVLEELLSREGLAGDFQGAVSLPGGKQSQANAPRTGPEHWLFLALVGSLLLLSIFASFMDHKQDSTKKAAGPTRLLLNFSLPANWRRLTAYSPPGSMNSINGIRVMSNVWIMLGHCYEIYGPSINGKDVQQITSSVPFMIVNNYTLAVDSFLAIGGLVCSISFLRSVKRTGFQWPKYVIHRYLRVTPVLALITFYGATWASFIRSVDYTPMGVAKVADWYLKYWWSSLVYVSNYIEDSSHFMPLSWYMSVDMQLYILAPIVLIPLWKWPSLGKVLLGLFTLGTCSIPGALSVIYKARNANALGISDPVAQHNAKSSLYFGTHSRFGQYLVGIAAGYFLHQVKYGGLKVNFTRVHVVAMWLLSAAVGLLVIIGPYSLLDVQNHEYNAVESFFYVGFGKVAWSVMVSMIVIACETGCGGPVNSILSWRPFGPLGRLGYTMYLVHFFVITTNSISLTYTTKYFTMFTLISYVILVFSLSNVLSALIYLLVEQPFILLETEIWKSSKPRPAAQCANTIVEDVRPKDAEKN